MSAQSCADVDTMQTLYDASFTVLTPRLWNSLPIHIRGEEKFEPFKAKLTAYMLAVPDHPPIVGDPSGNSILQRAGQIERLMDRI